MFWIPEEIVAAAVAERTPRSRPLYVAPPRRRERERPSVWATVLNRALVGLWPPDPAEATRRPRAQRWAGGRAGR